MGTLQFMGEFVSASASNFNRAIMRHRRIILVTRDDLRAILPEVATDLIGVAIPLHTTETVQLYADGDTPKTP